jgi:excisionase family DNA binding protein
MDDNTLLTTEQAAKRLGISKGTLDMWRYRGKGPRYVKFKGEKGRGGSIKYRLRDIQRYIEQSIRYTGDDNANNPKH